MDKLLDRSKWGLQQAKKQDMWRREDKYNENEKKCKDKLEEAKGVPVKFSEEELFWLEDLCDKKLYRTQNEAEIAEDKETLDNVVKKGRMYIRLCAKLNMAYQYTKLLKEKKKTIGKRRYGLRTIKAPYYLRDAEKEFAKWKKNPPWLN